MNLKIVLRIAIAFDWLFFILYLFLLITTIDSLPPELNEYINKVMNAPPSSITIAILEARVIVTGVLIAMISSIALLFFQKWARWSYLVSIVMVNVFGITMGQPQVMHALPFGVFYFSSLTHGFIIALTFFTDVLEKKPAGPPVLPVN